MIPRLGGQTGSREIQTQVGKLLDIYLSSFKSKIVRNPPEPQMYQHVEDLITIAQHIDQSPSWCTLVNQSKTLSPRGRGSPSEVGWLTLGHYFNVCSALTSSGS